MITAYCHDQDRIIQHELAATDPLPHGMLWLDLDRCTAEETALLEKSTGIQLPEPRELRLLDQHQQYYVEQGTLHAMTPVIIGGLSDQPRTGMMMFILSPTLLVTIRQGESQTVRNFAALIQREPSELASPATAFTGLLQAFVDRLADLSELIAHDMERVSHIVFQESLQRADTPGRGKPDSWRKVLLGLGKTARLNHRIISVIDGVEKVTVHARSHLDKTQQRRLDLVHRSTAHLSAQANAMVNEATFLLDAIVGAISIEQNNVIKIFSMVAVILMPPTMVASIYGMNFVHMPELAQVWGYPAALILMAISAFLPWWWFKRNGWF